MTLIISDQVTCSYCGERSEQHICVSSSILGAPDLDQRPGRLVRQTMHLWMQICPSCGLVAPSLNEESPSVCHIIAAENYRSAAADKGLPELARRFVCRAIIEESRGKLEMAALNYLRAAWAADDRELAQRDPSFKRKMQKYDEPDSVRRRLAIPFDNLPERIEDSENIGERAKELRRKSAWLFRVFFRQREKNFVGLKVVLVDILRRSEQWEDAAKECLDLHGEVDDEVTIKVLEFQQRLIGERDTRAFTVDHALGEGSAPIKSSAGETSA